MIFGFKKKRIYADWAATTPIHNCVARAMMKTRALWANPSAIHIEGVLAKKALENVRTECAKILSAKPDEIFFTSGGTESNNMIIKGVAEIALRTGDIHIVTTTIEHSSVLETVRDLEKRGASVTYVGTNANGIVSAEEVISAIRPNTVLVTCMLANNEIGTFQPISKIGAGIRKIRAGKVGTGDIRFPVFHTDASQAPLWISCDLEGLRVDALTLDAHKMQGPKGVGMIALRHGVPCAPLMFGGGQEKGKRPTTESLRLATGFTEALKIAHEGREKRVSKTLKAQKTFLSLLSELTKHNELTDSKIILNGSFEKRIPNNINISIDGLDDPEFAVIKLDTLGIACSTKSSCLKGEESSYVVAGLGGPKWRAKNTLRFSFSPDISTSELKKIVCAIKTLIL